MKSRVIKDRMHEGELESDLIGVKTEWGSFRRDRDRKIKNKVFFDTFSSLLRYSSLFSRCCYRIMIALVNNHY
jgi:hypothetical protein